MKKLNVLKICDQYGWAYDFLNREQARYSNHNIISCPIAEFKNLDGIDVVYIHSPDINERARKEIPRLAKEKGIPVIGAYAGEVTNLYSNSDLLVTISPQTYKYCKDKYLCIRTIFLPESVDTQFFTYVDRTDANYQVGWCGRESKVKRPYLLDKLNSYQISEWEAFNYLDPIGDERSDIHMAILATTIFNLAVDIHAKKGTKHREITEYLPKWGSNGEDEVVKQSVDEMKNILLSFAKSHNKKLEKSKPRRKPIAVRIVEEKPKDNG